MLIEQSANYDIAYRELVEEYILGTIILKCEKEETKEIIVRHTLSSTYFRKTIHKSIMDAILECYRQDAVPNYVHVGKFRPEEYQYNNSVEYTNYLIYLSDKAYVSIKPLNESIFILKQYVLMDFWNKSAIDVLYGNWNGRDVIQVGDNIIKGFEKTWKDLTKNLVADSNQSNYEEELTKKVAQANAGQTPYITTGSDAINAFVYGYANAELYIVAARPGMGKTTYALISCWAAARLGYHVLFFSLEMPVNQIKNKIISLVTGIDYKNIKSGHLNSEEFAEVIKINNEIDNSTLHIFGDIRYIDDVADKTKEMKGKGMCDMMALDYLQLVKVSVKTNMRESITEISRELKAIAKENYIPVLALSQLSRAVETRPNKRPILSDLKESSSIEEDADLVAFLYRQAYYDERNGFPIPYGELFHTEFIVAKGRDLGTGIIHIFLDAIKMKMYNYNPQGNYKNGIQQLPENLEDHNRDDLPF